MSIDSTLRDAGRRVDVMPISVPAPDMVVASSVRHRRRQRMVYAATCIILVVAVATIGIAGWGGDAPVDQGSVLGPPASGALGLTADRLWPPEGRSSDTASALGEDFVDQVLGWPESEVVEVARQQDTVELRATGPEGVGLRMLAQLVDGSWWLRSVGEGDGDLGVLGTPDGARTIEIQVFDEVDGAVSTRWWVVLDGEESNPVDVPATGRKHVYPIDVPIDDLGPVLVVFLDASGTAIGAVGGLF